MDQPKRFKNGVGIISVYMQSPKNPHLVRFKDPAICQMI